MSPYKRRKSWLCVTFMKGGEVVEPRPGSVIIGPKEKVDVKGLVGKFLPEGA